MRASPPAFAIPLLAALVASLPGCGDGFPDIECFGDDDCVAPQVCSAGECVVDGSGDAGADAGDAASDTTPDAEPDTTTDADVGDAPDGSDTDLDGGGDIDAADAADADDTADPDAADADPDAACDSTNACGGCTTLSEEVGTRCGICADHLWACDGTDAVTCNDGSTCDAPTCWDGLENGTETDVDCGGDDCPACDVARCVSADDCAWNERCTQTLCETVTTHHTDMTAVAGDRLGASVAARRRRFVAGAPGNAPGRIATTVWLMEGRLEGWLSAAPTGTGIVDFGAAVGTDGLTTLVGAPLSQSSSAQSRAGQIFVARPSPGEGFTISSVVDGAASDAEAGSALDIFGRAAWAGAASGAASYGFAGASGVDRVATLDAPGAGANLGASIAVGAENIVVTDGEKVFGYGTGEPVASRAVPTVGDLGAGVVVSASPATVVVGAPNHADGAQVQVFSAAASGFSALGVIETPAGATDFAQAVAAGPTRVAASATVDGDPAVLVFAHRDDAWVLEARLRHPTSPEGDTEFGAALAMSGTMLLVGSPSDDARGTDAGSVTVFMLCPTDAHGAQCETSCSDSVLNGSETATDCGGDVCGGCGDSETCMVPTDCRGGFGCMEGSCGEMPR